MNYIVLEGMSLYIFIFMLTLLLLISLACILYATLSDVRSTRLINLISKERDKVRAVYKENFRLKLKCGELNVDEKT